MSFDTSTPAPQPPLGAPVTPPSAPEKPKNTLGLVALILAIVGFVIGLIPLLGVVGWPLLIAAFVVAIVSLAKKGKPAWMGVVALVLSVVGPIVLGIVTAVTAASVVGAAIEESTGTSVEQSAEEEPASEEAPAEEPAEEAPAEESAAIAPIGTAAQTGNLSITVTQVEPGVAQVGEEIGGTLLGEKAQGQFVLVHVSVENVGAEAETFMDSNAKVYDAQGREFDANSGASIYIDGNSDAWLGEVNPGNTLQGVLVFDIPADASAERLEYQGMFDFLGEPAVLALK